MIDFYELLGVKKTASKDEIKLAYKNLVKKYHPDVNKNVDSNIIRNLNEAKEILLDDDKRMEYDLSLESLNTSKEFSKDKSETYESRSEEYKETYSEAYVTRWQFYMHYIKNSVDKLWKKLFKSVLVVINYLFFQILKLISYLIIYVCYLLEELIDFVAGTFMIFAILALFVNIGNGHQIFSFIPLKIQNFCVFLFIALLIEFIKLFLLNGSVNIFVFIQKLHDKLFIRILSRL